MEIDHRSHCCPVESHLFASQPPGCLWRERGKVDNDRNEGSLLGLGFLRDVKPQPTTACFYSDMGLFLVQHFNWVAVPSAQSPNVLSGTDYYEWPEAEGWHSSSLHAGQPSGPKISAGSRSNSLTCKGLFRASSAEVWAGNSQHKTGICCPSSSAQLC